MYRQYNHLKKDGNRFSGGVLILVLGITHLFPHNELVHLPYIAVATNTRADKKVKCSFL